MNQKNYPQMSKDHNPYDLENEKAHYEVFELLRRDQGVSIEEVIKVAHRSKTKNNAQIYISNFRKDGRNSQIIINLVNGRYLIKEI